MQNQLRSPIVMREIFPVGIIGLASVAMLGAFISTHDTYMHSWSAILVQDVILPFRKRPLSERSHLRLLRLGVVGIACFIYLFSLIFPHTQYIAMYLAISSAVFIAGAGAAIIGGLYWDRGTAAGAWAAMFAGMVLATAGILIEKLDPFILTDLFSGDGFVSAALRDGSLMIRHLTGQELNFAAMMAAALVYVLVSLAGRRRFNLDKLLHRGEYAMEGESSLSIRDARGFWERLGFSREFTGMDRVVTYITLGWPLMWTIAFVVVTSYALVVGIAAESWLDFWRVWMWGIFAAGIAVTLWLSIGGILDLRRMYAMLHTRRTDPRDDGLVHEER